MSTQLSQLTGFETNKSASEISRSLALELHLLKLSKQHPEAYDTVIRALDHFLSQRAPFRFLDLPAELRLHIASYAVTDGPIWPLEFTWTVYKPSSKVGTFVTGIKKLDIDELTARMCAPRFTQLEAQSLICANNALFFNQRPVDDDRACDPAMSELSVTDNYKYIEESFAHALEHYPEAFCRTPHVVFETF